MTDLRARFLALDRIPSPDLWGEIERRAVAALPVAPVVAGSASWRAGRAAARSASAGRLALALVVITLGLGVLVGAAVVGGLFRDPLRADLAPTTVEPTAAPNVTMPVDPAPSVGPSLPPAPGSGIFTSNLYGFSIRHPDDWRAFPASTPWTGAGAWDQAPEADRLAAPSPGNATFAVVALAAPANTTLDGWIAAHPIDRKIWDPARSGCVQRGARFHWIPGGPPSWADGLIGAWPARIRSECGHLDGVVIVHDSAYIFSLSPGELTASADLVTYRHLVDQVGFGSAPPPAPTETFSSPTYGYSIVVDAAFTVEPARFTWSPPDGYGRGFDRFEGWWGTTFRIASAPIPNGRNEEDWLSSILPPRLGGGCPPTPVPWRATRIAGTEGAIRSASATVELSFGSSYLPWCEQVEAYAIVSGRMYAFQATAATEQELLAFLATLEFHPGDVTSAAIPTAGVEPLA
jgi:hypothetical protein